MISEPGASVTCTRNNMTVTLEKETYHFFNVSQLRLRYASCRATENSTHFMINTPLNDCGTLVNETEHFLIFWNEVQADALIIDNVVTRTHDIKLPFSCRYSRKTLQSLGFTPQSIYFGYEGKARIPLLKNISSAICYIISQSASQSVRFCFNLSVVYLINVKLCIFSKSSTFVLQK